MENVFTKRGSVSISPSSSSFFLKSAVQFYILCPFMTRTPCVINLYHHPWTFIGTLDNIIFFVLLFSFPWHVDQPSQTLGNNNAILLIYHHQQQLSLSLPVGLWFKLWQCSFLLDGTMFEKKPFLLSPRAYTHTPITTPCPAIFSHVAWVGSLYRLGSIINLFHIPLASILYYSHLRRQTSFLMSFLQQLSSPIFCMFCDPGILWLSILCVVV